MKLYKKYLLGGTLLLSMTTHAQDNIDCVVVETTKGETMEYLLSEEPRIKQEADIVMLTTKRTTVEFVASSISKIYLSESKTSIIRNNTNNGRNIHINNEQLILSGFKYGEQVSLYRANGSFVWENIVEKNGQLFVSLEGLPTGIYILKTDSLSAKIIKK